MQNLQQIWLHTRLTRHTIVYQCIKYKRHQISKRGLRHWDQFIQYPSI